MRVAVIGARQARSGTGAHLARFFAEAGAEVVALFGTSEVTAQEAVDILEASTGQRAQACWDADALATLELDAAVIATPDDTHASWIHRSFEAGLHVLCEKPLVWGGADRIVRTRILVTRARQAQRVLRVAAQWPFTLPAYEALFPGVLAGATSFTMLTAPSVTGPDMFRVSLSHPLSILATVVPDMDAEVRDPEVTLEPDGKAGSIQFVYAGAGRHLDCTVHVRHQAGPPREMAYGFDDHIARRIVHLPAYRLELEGAGRRVPMPDPMPLLVRSFLEEAALDQPRLVDPAVEPGMRHLVDLMAAMPDEDSPSP